MREGETSPMRDITHIQIHTSTPIYRRTPTQRHTSTHIHMHTCGTSRRWLKSRRGAEMPSQLVAAGLAGCE